MSSSKKRKPLVVFAFSLFLPAALLSSFCFKAQRSDRDDVGSTTLKGHRFPVRVLAFALDGTKVTSAAFHLTSGPAGEVELIDWDVKSARPTSHRTTPFSTLRCLALAPEGRGLAVAGDGGIWLCDMDAVSQRRPLSEDGTTVYALAFSGDGRLLATADPVSDVVLWDVASGRQQARCQSHPERVFALTFAPDGTVLAGGSSDGTIRLWDVVTGEELGMLLGHVRYVETLAFSPDGRALVSGDLYGVVKLWDVATRTERATLLAVEDQVNAVVFAPNGRTLAVAIGRAVELWDVVRACRLARLEGHEGKVNCLAFSPDGSRLASGSYDKTVRLWDVAR